MWPITNLSIAFHSQWKTEYQTQRNEQNINVIAYLKQCPLCNVKSGSLSTWRENVCGKWAVLSFLFWQFNVVTCCIRWGNQTCEDKHNLSNWYQFLSIWFAEKMRKMLNWHLLISNISGHSISYKRLDYGNKWPMLAHAIRYLLCVFVHERLANFFFFLVIFKLRNSRSSVTTNLHANW